MTGTHLYLDQDSTIQDKIIEGMFDDIIDNNIDDLLFHNFSVYSKQFFNSADMTKSIYNHSDLLISWALCIGSICLWVLSEEDKLTLDSETREADPMFGCKFGNLKHGKAVTGDSVKQVVMLSIVQMMRELAFEDNNASRGLLDIH